MLNLHQAIEQVCPIVGIADLGDGNYRIDFAEDATPEQQAAAWAVLENYQPPEQPDWDEFRSRILIHPAYLRIAASTPVAQTVNAVLAATLWQVGGNPALLPDVAQMWNVMAGEAAPTEAEIEALNEIGEVCHMPFRLNQQGMISL